MQGRIVKYITIAGAYMLAMGRRADDWDILYFIKGILICIIVDLIIIAIRKLNKNDEQDES